VTGRQPEPEHYVAVPLAVLDCLKALWLEDETDRISLGTVRLLLRSVRLDNISGNLVLGVRVVRSLDDEPPDDSGHFGTT
jgi:hypothetical protein